MTAATLNMKTQRLAVASAVFLMAFYWGILLFCNLGYVFGFSVSVVTLFLAIGLALIVLVKISKNFLAFINAICLSLAIFAFAVLVSTYSIDLTWDGWAYHEPATIFLANGWNPNDMNALYSAVTTMNRDVGSYLGEYPNMIWIEAYPKGAWEIASAFLKSGFSIDASKMFGIIASIVATMLVFEFCKLCGYSLVKTIFISPLLVYSPVVISQLTTYYVDGLLGSLFAILVFGALNYCKSNYLVNLLFVLFAGTMLVTLKFTGLIYFFVLCFPIGFYIYRLSGGKFLFFFSVLIFAVVILFAWSPYVTNYQNHGYFFYPFDIVNVMDGQMSPVFLENNRFTKILLSMFSGNNPSIKDPCFLCGYSWTDFELLGQVQDLHVNAFGPFFGAMLFLAILRCFFVKKSAFRSPVFVILCATLISVVINPEMWWARYVPQLWLVPFLMLFLPVVHSIKLLDILLVSLPLITSLIVFGYRTYSAVNNYREYSMVGHVLNEKKVYVRFDDGLASNFLPSVILRSSKLNIDIIGSKTSCSVISGFFLIKLCAD